nr:hypothetical protein [Tanacetum cinerariifolium]
MIRRSSGGGGGCLSRGFLAWGSPVIKLERLAEKKGTELQCFEFGDGVKIFMTFTLLVPGVGWDLHWLKNNLLKSKLIGVGVSFTQVEQLSEVIGCGASNIPFTHLGLPMVQVMSRIQAWKPITDKFDSKFTSWKAKTLSIKERLALIKSVLESMGSYFMSLFPAPATILLDLERLWALFFLGEGADVDYVKLELIMGRGRGDTWLRPTPLFTQFSRIADLDDMHVISVVEGLRFGWVASSLQREPRGGVETEQWEAISS